MPTYDAFVRPYFNHPRLSAPEASVLAPGQQLPGGAVDVKGKGRATSSGLATATEVEPSPNKKRRKELTVSLKKMPKGYDDLVEECVVLGTPFASLDFTVH